MKTRIQWTEDPELRDFFPDRMAWTCNCGEPLVVVWASSCALYEPDPITVEGAISSHWQLECHAGHVLLLAHEMEDVDESADTFAAPTVEEIVTQPDMAYVEDIAAWRQYQERMARSLASTLRTGQGLRRGVAVWTVLEVDEVDPRPLSAPYVRLKCRDDRGEVHSFTLPADEPVEVVAL